MTQGRDELASRALWVRQNGRMQERLAELVGNSGAIGVYQLCDDPECSVTLKKYVVEVLGKSPRAWFSMPMHVPRKDGKWDPANRSPAEMQALLGAAKSGDLLVVPVNRSNVQYNRMPIFRYAAQLFPGVVPGEIQRRLHCIYSDYEQFAHPSIPLHLEKYLLSNNRQDILSSLQKSGMQLGFGWQIYQVR